VVHHTPRVESEGQVASHPNVERSTAGPHQSRSTSTDSGANAHYAGAVKIRRLHREPGELTPEEATSGLRLGDLAPPDRPYLVLNMVATLDGRVAIHGRSGPIGDEADWELFHGLRTQVDAVMVGAGTLRTERYGPIVRSPERRARRVAEGLAPDPLAVIVSASLRLPEDLPLLQDENSTVVVLTTAGGELPPVPARVHYLRGPAGAELELAPLLRRLRAEFSVRSILCEGGPSLNASLVREGLVDELFLSIAPKLAGGPPLTILTGDPLPEPLQAELVSLLEHEGHLFGRYRLQDPLQV
jgi:5-amino-6-(5-phosphoribosylamino)uracil reductase